MTEFIHRSVLLNEAVEALNIDSNSNYVDATFGRGGYTREMLRHITHGQVIGIDRDREAIDYGKKHFAKEITDGRLKIFQANYGQLAEIIQVPIKGIVFDLGVSSPQFDDPKRGFSYRFEGPLDMRMDQDQELTAFEVVNSYSAQQLKRIFQQFGNAPLPYQVAQAIVTSRQKKLIRNTIDLVTIIENTLPEAVKRKKGHPAKRYFQALRIEVNNEYGSLKQGLEQALEVLEIGGIVSVVTFQPLEDKLVSQTFRSLARMKPYPKGIPIIPEEVKPELEIIHKRAIKPSTEELEQNRRAHSARLRIARKVRKISFR
ncbi:16S rRNA (cytosine(1402)-N(4))-methyltransferase RsmH [Xylocopilactobacillus apicola]|uniref:16S rRNA (cytosine(1402)-N(4))-methyltransferase RsmH n=1 Tax=Xylocopilactobacillus apicola TaxID=2932184 RepID=UPI0029535B7C|nr:16S rRNA (cytosine(1402)-N(4))-methyltransferase RsmH [Xylocopilactobacillus apicola]